MIPPQELKNKSFTRAGKGYDTTEVDEYIDFIIEKYSEIFAQCDKYDKKLRIVSARISEIQNEEETIHKLIISTQKNCDRLISEAEEEARNKILGARETAEEILTEAREKAQSALSSIERKAAMQIDATQQKSDALLLSARTRCTKLLSEFKKEVSIQRENILSIKAISEEFNSKLLAMYKNHLNLLNENTYIPSIDFEGFTESKIFENVMQEIKIDAAEIAKKTANVEYDFEKELESLKKSGDFIYNEQSINEKTSDEITKDKYAYKENDEDVDVKVFTKTKTDHTNGEAGGDTYEKPMATYDSDDYENVNNKNYSDEVYGIDGGGEDDYEDPEDSENSEDLYDDAGAGSKKLFGLFKNKKKNKKKPRQYDPGEDEDGDEDVADIFEDLEEDEE